MSQTFEVEEIDFQTSVMRWSGGCGHVSQVAGYFPKSAMWTELFVTACFGVAVPLKGGYRRKANGITQFVDRNTGFFRGPDEEVCVAHVTGKPDELTVVHVELDELAELDQHDWGSGALLIEPAIDLQHRILLRHVRNDADSMTIEADLIELVRLCVAQKHESFDRSSRRVADRSHVVARVCELMHNDISGSMSLVDLAREVGYSPFHLSHLFSESLGMPLSKYRMRLRVRDVIDRLEQGEDDLAALAMDTGFADHSHMTRTVVSQFGVAPSRLRALLRDPRAAS